MTDEEQKQLAALISKSLTNEFDKRKRIDEETHRVHHEYIEHRIKERKRTEDFRDDVKKKVTGWGVILAIGAIVTLIGDGILSHIKELKG